MTQVTHNAGSVRVIRADQSRGACNRCLPSIGTSGRVDRVQRHETSGSQKALEIRGSGGHLRRLQRLRCCGNRLWCVVEASSASRDWPRNTRNQHGHRISNTGQWWHRYVQRHSAAGAKSDRCHTNARATFLVSARHTPDTDAASGQGLSGWRACRCRPRPRDLACISRDS
jgi:hypothetical protein